jgi:hypothetical protein
VNKLTNKILEIILKEPKNRHCIITEKSAGISFLNLYENLEMAGLTTNCMLPNGNKVWQRKYI